VALAQLVVVCLELFELSNAVFSVTAKLLSQIDVLRGRTGGAEVVSGFGVEMVDGRCHGRILILECVDVLA